MLPVKREKGLGMNLMDLSITAKIIFQKTFFLRLEKLLGTHSPPPPPSTSLKRKEKGNSILKRVELFSGQ